MGTYDESRINEIIESSIRTLNTIKNEEILKVKEIELNGLEERLKVLREYIEEAINTDWKIEPRT